MAKFSVGGDDDGEGTSNPTQKRRRITLSYGTVREDEREDIDNQSGTEEGDAFEQELEVLQTEEHVADVEDPFSEDSYEFTNFGARSNDSGRENKVSARNARDRSISITLTDPDVLDCCICYEPLSMPIFQCENGHIACPSCCVKLGNKCPMCSMPIGYNRCRAMEKVLESFKISCFNARYGCKETLSYSKKNDHEKECIYAPCICPHSSCNFVASSKELSLHFSRKHVGSAINFTYDRFFTVFLKVEDKVIVLQEQNDANLFMLNNKVELLGNIVNVSCIGPNSLKTVFHYDILVKSQGCCLKLQSFAKNNQGRNANTPSTGFLLIPCDFFGSCGQLKLDICIRCNVTDPAESRDLSGVHL